MKRATNALLHKTARAHDRNATAQTARHGMRVNAASTAGPGTELRLRRDAAGAPKVSTVKPK